MLQEVAAWVTVIGAFLTLLALGIAIKQILDNKCTLRRSSELLLRQTKLLFETAKRMQSCSMPTEDDRREIVERWSQLLACAKQMYDDAGWKELVESLKGGQGENV